jgi:NAD-dependent dihydropyrimidine dehydrogenase PreA subunit
MGPRSLVLLGWNFLLHLLSRATFLYRRGGTAKFRENFDPERLFPVTPEDRPLLASWQSCVACGLCEQVCPELLSAVPGGRGVGPQLVASGLHREMPSYGLSWPDAEALSRCEGCGDCEAICPTQVPLRELASFIVRVGQRR